MKSFIRISIIFAILLISGTNIYSQVTGVSVSVTKNVSCNGGSDGELVVTVNGGTPPYSIRVIDINNLIFYNRVSATGVETFSGLLASDFLVRAKDGSLPELWQGAFATITQPAALLLSASSTDITCNGDLDGKISATATGGTPDYTYKLKKGGLDISTVSSSGSVDFTGLAAGNDYTVEIVDSKGCGPVIGGPYTIVNPAVLSGSVTSQTDVLCFGESTGSVTITPSGGTSPYEYSLNGGGYQASSTISGLPAGNHTITIRDAHLCTANVPVTITQPASALTGSITSQTNVLCFGDNTGSVTVNKSGGVGPWQYSLDGGPYQASGTFNSLTAGSYTVTIRDNNLCTFNVPVTITEPAELIGTITAQTNVSCFGGNNGSVTVSGSGGVGPYQYSLDGGAYQASGTFGTLTAGSYTVTVRDANMCTENVPVTITQPTALGGSITSQSNVSCFGGNNGSVTVAGSGGTAPYQYKLGAGSYQASGMFSGLTVGSYTVTVRDANLCTFDVAVSITQPASAVSGSITAQTNVSCFGGNNGSVTVAGSGGTSPYQYKLGAGAYQASGTFGTLTAGSYTVTVRDANLCTFDVAVTITQPTALGGSITAQTNVSCFGGNNGSVTVAGSGGLAPYEYKLGAGAYQASGTFGTLTAGSYTVTVRDANLCTFDVAVTITQPAAAVSGSITAQTNVSCFGGNNGSVTVSGSGGTAPYDYKLGVAGAYQSSGTFSGLTAGLYTVTVRDANLCTFDVAVTITQPAATVSGSITAQTNVSCFGGNNGSVTVLGSGGTAPYQYKLGVGAYQASGTFGTLTAGSYTVTVRDANLCTFDVAVTITQPTALVGSITAQTNVSCFGGNNGSVTVAGSGGIAPYEYKLGAGAYQASGAFGTLTAGNYTVTVRDANLCTFDVAVTITQPAALGGSITSQTNVLCNGGNNGSVTVAGSGGTAPYEYKLGAGAYQASGTFGTLTAGSYTVTVRDANLCTFDLTVTITQPIALGGSITGQTNVSCFGGNNGSATVLGSGGTAPYEYKLGVAGAYQASGTFSGLTAGLYTVTVRDVNLCTFDVAVTITQPLATVSGSITGQTNVSCFGGNNGSVTVAGSGGTSPYQYSLNGGTYQGSGTFSSLTAGSYTVTVRDANLCTFNVPVIITEPNAIGVASLTANPVTGCFGNSNGSILIEANGGTPNYTYTLFLGAAQIGAPQTPVFPAGANFTGLTAGTYSVTITDANACPVYTETNIVLSEPPQLIINNVTSVDVVCNGESTGSITISASGGTPAITYSIAGEFGTYVASNSFTGLASGDYEVWVKDANGCTATWGNVYIGEPEAISVSVSFKVINTCYGDNTGEITITPYPGGLSDYDYTLIQFPTPADWGNNNQFLGLAAGNYYPQVRQKSSGCIAKAVTSPIVITQPTQINFNIIPTNVTGCSYNTNGVLRVQDVTGGIGPWQTSLDQVTWLSTPRNFTNLGVGNHIIYVRDSKGCVAQKTAILTGPAPIVINPLTITDATCFGASDGTISVTASGGTGVLEYSVNGTVYQATGNFTGLSANTYTIYVRDANGCIATSTAIVGQPTALYFTTQTATNITCNGLSDGQITLVAAGGSGSYSYSINGGLSYGNVTGVFTGLPAGSSYVAAVQDGSGCSTIGNTLTITEPDLLTIDTEAFTDIVCYGDNNGSIDVKAKGGTNPLTYTLLDVGLNVVATNGTGTFTGLSAGAYTVNIDDANGCGPITAGPYTIAEPTQLTFTYTKIDLTCFGVPTGQIDVDATGGTPPYEYSFDGGATFVAGDVKNGLAGGNHTVIVRDANLCTSNQSITIDEPTELAISLAATNITCNGLTDGQIIATATGGTTTVPYQYRIDGGAWQASGTFSSLSAGTYLIEVQDANGCIDGDNATIIEPTVINVDLVNSVVVNPTCSTLGSITAMGQGGTPPYTYTLNPGPGQIVNVTGIFTDLAIGSYTVRIDDANGCPAFDWSVTLAGPPALDYSVVSTPLLCFGNKSTITINVTSGTAPYEYSIDNEVTYGVNNVFTDIAAGSYQIWVKDASGCKVNKTEVIVEPAEIVLGTPVVTQETAPGASNGVIALTATGGTAPLKYDLYLNGALNSTQTPVAPAGASFSGLSAGTYYIVVTDANGCNKQTADIVISGISIQVTQTDVLCNGSSDGKILVTITGGIPPFTVGCISVPGGQVYPVNNIAPGQFQFENLAAGDYLISITDGVPVVFPNRQVTIAQPQAMVANYLSHINPTCNGLTDGSVEFTITGGTPDYTITWTGGGPSTGNIATNVGAGTHVFTITDANNCSVVVNDVPEIVQPTAILATVAKVDPTCYGEAIGSITTTATGGTGSLTYSLTLNSNIVATNDNGLFEDLIAGNYTLNVVDDNNCAMNPAVDIVLSQPSQITITGLTPTEPLLCPNIAEGYVRISVNGGQPDYTFLWSNGQTTADLENVVSGDYTITVTDALGCMVTDTFTVNGPAMLDLDPVIITNANCRLHDIGIYTGKIEIQNSTGGNGTFDDLDFKWINHKGVEVDGNVLSNVPAGTYTVTVTDAKSCVYSKDYDVPINPLNNFVADAGKDTTVCYNNPVVLVGNVSDNGNTGFIFSYEWQIDNGTSFETVANTKNYTIQLKETETYQFRVLESNSGCVDTSIIKVDVLPEIGLEVPLYISAVKDSIISVLMGTEFNMDVITKSFANFQWKPGILFVDSLSWNSSMFITPEVKEQIKQNDPSRIVILEDPVSKKKTEFILVDVIAKTDKSCIDSIRLYTKIVDDVAIGNVFSPNGDGKNDVWRVPKNYLFPDLEIEIFNRWGSLVWSAKGDEAANGWDGRTNSGNELPIGTYYYVLKFNVQAQGSNWKPVTGSITIVK